MGDYGWYITLAYLTVLIGLAGLTIRSAMKHRRLIKQQKVK